MAQPLAARVGKAPAIPYAITDPLADQKAAFLASERAAYADVQRLIDDMAARSKISSHAILDPLEDMKQKFLAAEKGGYEDTLALMRDMADRAEEAQDAVRDLGLTFTSAFEDAIVGGKKASAVLQSLAQDVLRVFVRQSITAPAGNWLAGLFAGGLFGGARANGGPVSAGRAYLVGERGPEMIVPSAPGVVIPRVGATGSTVNVNITQHIGQGVSRSEVYAASMQAKESAKSELLQLLQRRGAAVF